MSAPKRTGRGALAEAVPEEWQSFLDSGEFSGTRASIQVDGSDVPVDFAARLEFLDEGRLVVHVALAEDDSRSVTGSAPPLTHLLTPRERAVITLIAMGHETGEIAETLYLSPSTVRTHVRNAMLKLGAHTRAQLVAIVLAGGQPVQADHPA
jgi:DNA-binding CsgD family transcriptional regulator